MYYSKFERLEKNFVQPDDPEFKESEELSLIQIVAKLYDDISFGKGLQRDFSRNSAKHDPFYAIFSEIQKLPYNITGFFNRILPRPEPGKLTEEDMVAKVIRKGKTYELSIEYQDPGSFARVADILPWVDIRTLPIWMTNDLEQMRQRNILKTYSDAMEFAEELEKLDERSDIPGLKKLIIDFEKNNADFLDHNANFQSINDKILPITQLIRDYISKEELSLLITLAHFQKIEGYSPEAHRKHSFTKKSVSPILRKLKYAESADDAFKLNFFEQIREDIRYVTRKINPVYVAAAIAIPIALAAGYLMSVGVNKALHYADLHRTYKTENTEIPSYYGLSDIQGYGLEASQAVVPATQLYNFDPETSEHTERELLAQIFSRANSAITRGKALQPLFHDPELQRAVDLIYSGGNIVYSAFSDSYYPHEVCESKDSGGTPTVECRCDYATNTFTKNQSAIDEGVRQINEGLSILVSGYRFSDLPMPLADRKSFENGSMDLIKYYAASVSGRDGLNADLDYLASEISGYPDYDFEINYACINTSWRPMTLGGQIDHMTTQLGYLSQIAGMLDASVQSFETRASAISRARDPEDKKREAADLGTDQNRALGLGWLGYVYQDEIDWWTKGVFYAATALAFAGSMWAYNEYGDALFAKKREEFSLN